MSISLRVFASLLVCLSILSTYALNQSFGAGEEFLNLAPVVTRWFGQGVIIQYTLLTIGMWLVWQKANMNRRKDFYWIILLGLACRIAILPVEPYLSNDVYRYLFDGYIAGIGLDPYQVSHDDPRLAHAVTLWSPPDEHLKYPTLYPPFSIFLLSLISHWGPHTAFVLWKLITFLASIGVMILGACQLKQLNQLRHFPLIALSPILIFEAGIGLHLDALCALFVLGAFALFYRHHYRWCGLFIGLGTLTKLLPLLLVVPLITTLKKWDKSVKLLSSVIITILAGYSVALMVGWQPVGSLQAFFEKFRFGSLFYFVFEPLLGLTITGSISLIATGVGLLAIVHAANKQSQTNIAQLAQWTLLLPLLTGPVVYPWYLMAIIPLMAMYPSRAVLVWVSLQPLTYEVLTQFLCCGNWQPQAWPMIISLVGLSGALLYDFKSPLHQGTNKR